MAEKKTQKKTQKSSKKDEPKVNAAAKRAIDEKVGPGKKVSRFNRPDLQYKFTAHPDAGENTKFLEHSLHMWDWQRPDMTDHVAVVGRIRQYFQLCADDDMKPSVEGLAVAFCTDRKTLWRWANGTSDGNQRITDETRDAIKKAYSMIGLQMANYMQNGKIHPLSGMFFMKNNFGYSDQTEVIVTPNATLGEAVTQKRLEADYIIDITPDETE